MDSFRMTITKLEGEFKSALPAQIPADRFVRTIITTVQMNPELLECTKLSLLSTCMKAAQDGLLPDGREGKIVVFNTKINDKWVKAAQWMPMVGGLMKLARNSGEIASLNAQVVYRGEPFRVVLGDEDRIVHERVLDAVDANQPVAVYAIAVLRDGTRVHEAMTWKQVMKVKGASASGDRGPWGAWPDEMARKTVLRRLLKRLPLSTDRDGDRRLVQAVESVDEDHPRIAAGSGTAAGMLADETGGRLDGLEAQLDTPERAPVPNDDAADDDGFPGDR
jgi:recombination protein RecT